MVYIRRNVQLEMINGFGLSHFNYCMPVYYQCGVLLPLHYLYVYIEEKICQIDQLLALNSAGLVPIGSDCTLIFSLSNSDSEI